MDKNKKDEVIFRLLIDSNWIFYQDRLKIIITLTECFESGKRKVKNKQLIFAPFEFDNRYVFGFNLVGDPNQRMGNIDYSNIKIPISQYEISYFPPKLINHNGVFKVIPPDANTMGLLLEGSSYNKCLLDLFSKSTKGKENEIYLEYQKNHFPYQIENKPEQNIINEKIIEKLIKYLPVDEVNNYLEYQLEKYPDKKKVLNEWDVKLERKVVSVKNDLVYYTDEQDKISLACRWVKDKIEQLKEVKGKSKQNDPFITFKWQGSPERLIKLHKELSDIYIKADFEDFKKVFSGVPLESIVKPIKWILVAKNGYPNKKALLDLISILNEHKNKYISDQQATANKFLGGYLFEIIEKCFVDNNKNPFKFTHSNKSTIDVPSCIYNSLEEIINLI